MACGRRGMRETWVGSVQRLLKRALLVGADSSSEVRPGGRKVLGQLEAHGFAFTKRAHCYCLDSSCYMESLAMLL